ncbi:MAG TPA: thioredoxin domain-containing protein [Ignavibacteriaceae bacterium]|nr:thioredoxin domain-containing protein [Ignavibacteriaceae bacterium]
MNHLAKEKSPYLLQHAHNPVDWFPWCEEAFSKAKLNDKPVFLSIGYSTCHWCHVMEKESFEDMEVAGLMNEVFVSIKVDREERPDIDGIYMTVCQMLTGSGGWPMTIIMTPDKKPFFAGTYFPKVSRFGRIGMLELVPKINEIWKSKRDDILKSAEDIAGALQKDQHSNHSVQLSESIFDKAYNNFDKRFDKENGGFYSAPKFPTPHNLTFLLRYWKRKNEPHALEMVEKTLMEMRKGGIYDQIGYGFHRYSTDSKWLVPHFEKMLYDQALLSIAYTEAYQATDKKIYKRTAEEILTYVLRDMTSPEGGFYSAEDADSEGEEGKFYLWSQDEIQNVLNKDDAKLLIEIYNIEKSGVLENQSNDQKIEEHILHLKISPDALPPGMIERTDSLRKKLFEIRESRIHPYKDDKILTDWNSLIVSALARASQVFGNSHYIAAAEKAALFILGNMTDKKGILLHRYRDNEAAVTATLDDYSFLICALIDLYEATFKTYYLKKAIEFTEYLIHNFWDEEEDAFFFTGIGSEKLLLRQKEIYDGAVPSGNSISVLNLLKLGRFTGNNRYDELASKIISCFSNSINESPASFTQALAGLDFAFGPSYEIVVAGERDSSGIIDILNGIRKKFLPNKILILNSDDDNDLKEISSFIKYQTPVNEKPTVYICQNFNCNIPLTQMKNIFEEIEKL